MSDQNDPFAGTDDSPVIRALRQQNQELAAELKELRGEVSTMRRSSVFDDLGIPKTGPAAFFREKYDGELSAEKIRQAAQDYGILAPEPPATAPEEQGMIDRMFEPSAHPPKADASASQALMQKIQNAGSNDDIEAFLEANNMLVIE